MPVESTGRKHVSELIKGAGVIEELNGVNYFYARVPVKGSGDIEPIGTPLVWNNGDSAFNVYLAQDISAVAGTPALPDASPVCVTVGAKEGLGFNKADVTLSATATEMVVLFRGPTAIATDGVEFGAANQGDIDEFMLQMEKQGVAAVASAEDIVSSYITA